MKKFPCEVFGKKSDYSDYEKETWEKRTHDIHLQQVSIYNKAKTASDQQECEKKFGVRYSDLLRLPYFDIVQYHVIDPMHNLLLGTAKYLMTMWKDDEILTKTEFDYIQQEVDAIKVPAGVGRIPHKISSKFSGFTADQWKNWLCIYSAVCLKEILPLQHYECWMLFQDACCSLLQPSISTLQLSIAENKLYEFCKAYETLYGKEKCTPNMHMHMHLGQSVQNYGPVTSFWCFPFERFNGILGSFQKSWISPELQMAKKFLSYQHLLLMDVSVALPAEIQEFFENNITKCSDISVGDGSLMQTHVDGSDLLNYKKNSICVPSQINAREGPMHKLYRRYESIFPSDELASLTTVYQALYPNTAFEHVPMVHERFHALEVFNEMVTSTESKGNHSSAVCANWAGVGGNLATDFSLTRVGIIQYFIRHAVRLPSSVGSTKVSHIFARVHWFATHPRENWFSHRSLILSPDLTQNGPATFLPVSRIHCCCALTEKKMSFDYGEDKVIVAILCGTNYSV